MMPPRTGRRLIPGVAAVAAALLLVGLGACGSAGEPATDTVREIREITVSIVDGSVDPAPARIDVARGQTVRVTVTSDVADMVHVHGYDKSVALQPGVAGTVEFVADLDGLYDVETHEQDLQLFQLVVR